MALFRRQILVFALAVGLVHVVPAVGQEGDEAAAPAADLPGLPEVNVDALMQQVNTLADELRAEAQRLIDGEGAEKAVERLRAEAEADEAVAFKRLNLASVVALLAEDAEATIKEIPAATDEEMPLALARHALIIEAGDPDVRAASVAKAMRAGLQQ